MLHQRPAFLTLLFKRLMACAKKLLSLTEGISWLLYFLPKGRGKNRLFCLIKLTFQITRDTFSHYWVDSSGRLSSSYPVMGWADHPLQSYVVLAGADALSGIKMTVKRLSMVPWQRSQVISSLRPWGCTIIVLHVLNPCFTHNHDCSGNTEGTEFRTLMHSCAGRMIGYSPLGAVNLEVQDPDSVVNTWLYGVWQVYCEDTALWR